MSQKVQHINLGPARERNAGTRANSCRQIDPCREEVVRMLTGKDLPSRAEALRDPSKGEQAHLRAAY